MLDILFQNRNKNYGAYELRSNYPQRIKKALLITFLLAGSTVASLALGNRMNRETIDKTFPDTIRLVVIPDEQEPEEIIPPKPLPQPAPAQVRTEHLATIQIVKDDEVPAPPPDQDDLKLAKIGLIKQDGVEDLSIPENSIQEGMSSGIIETKMPSKDEPDIFIKVEKEAEFDGNWQRFLERTLNANVPVDKDAPPGTYRILMQFVVDTDGNVSDIKPLTNLGYGMEEEAVRVLKKAKKWKPAFQNGRTVKAYRKQQITFVVTQE